MILGETDGKKRTVKTVSGVRLEDRAESCLRRVLAVGILVGNGGAVCWSEDFGF